MSRKTPLTDYERIAQSFAWIEAARARRPDSSELAAAAGLGGPEYQVLLQAWAGVSPGRLLEILETDYLRRVLRQSGDLPGGLHATGSSNVGAGQGQGFELDAIPVREAASERTGRVIGYGEAETPFGRVAIGFTWRGVCHLSFLSRGGRAEKALREAWPEAELTERPERAEKLFARIFSQADAGSAEPLRAWVIGSEFQLRVWKALVGLPSGHLWSYAELAARAGSPGAARAVGSAMASNPLAFLIPCHRVLRQNGELGHYGGGSVRKALMIAREAAQRECRD